MKTAARLWIGLALLVGICPLGLLLPEYFKAGAAWGEWTPDEIQKLVGYIPKGLEKLSAVWSSPIPDYSFKGWGEKGLDGLSLGYIVSAILGIGVIVVAMLFIGKLLSLKE